jgi:hypothetical protein
MDFAFSLCSTHSDQRNRRIRGARRSSSGPEGSRMRSAVLKRTWQFRLLIAVIAIVPTECNVLCNPFSPLQILRWTNQIDFRTTRAEPHEAFTVPREAEATENSHHASAAAVEHDRGEGTHRVDLPVEIDEVVAVRPRTILRALTDVTGFPVCAASIDTTEGLAAQPVAVSGAASQTFGTPVFRMLC